MRCRRNVNAMVDSLKSVTTSMVPKEADSMAPPKN